MPQQFKQFRSFVRLVQSNWSEMVLKRILKEYLENSTLHGAKFLVDDDSKWFEKLFWIVCIAVSWFASGMLISASLDAFENNAISFVVETSYRDWDTNFPAIVVCETKNLDRMQDIADKIWGTDHDFALEEVLGELTYFRGESFHTINECAGNNEDEIEGCFKSNFSYYATMARSPCSQTIDSCFWNDKPFNCCEYFQPMKTEIGICYALNSLQVANKKAPKLNMISNKYTKLGNLKISVLTEVNIYTLGEEDVPTLVTSNTDMLEIRLYVSHTRLITIKNIENGEGTRDVDVKQRNCRFNDENILNVYKHYSYSACTVQCRKDKQLAMCNCTSHLTPNTPEELFCNMTGLICLNLHYDDLSVIIPKWSTNRKGLVCDCLPSCTEVDISIVHDSIDNQYQQQESISKVEIGLAALPTERYKRNVVRGKLDLVVSMGGTTGLFVGASLLSFVEIIYYFTIRPYGTMLAEKRRK